MYFAGVLEDLGDERDGGSAVEAEGDADAELAGEFVKREWLPTRLT